MTAGSTSHDPILMPTFQRLKGVQLGSWALDDSGLLQAQKAFLPRVPGSAAVGLDQPPDARVQIGSKTPKTLTRSVPQRSSFEAKLFDSLVSLKVAVSQYAMHLSSDQRRRIFARLDDLINVEDWHEEDALPRIDSFKDFLKWTIYSKREDWSSIGISDQGNILVAWTTPDVTLTANFDGKNNVAWTATIESAEPKDRAVGRYALQNFSKQALFYLSGEAIDAND